MSGVRPLAALDSHVRLIRALRNPAVGPTLVNGPGFGSRAGSGAMANLLDTAATFVVTDRMLSAVLEQMPLVEFGQPLLPEQVALFPAGYVVLPRPVELPITVVDTEPDVIPRRSGAAFDAGFWVQTGDTMSILREGPLFSDDDGNYGAGLMYGQSISPGLAARYAVDAESAEGLEWLKQTNLLHIPVYATGWAYELSWDPQYRDETFVLTEAGEFERRFWMTLWRLLGDEVVAPVRFRRHELRQMARGRDRVPEVVVCDLRRVRHVVREEKIPEGGTILWSHRWKVRGHQRTLHRGTPQERTIWVREYEKGPEHLPLLEKDRVYRLSR